MKEGRCCDFKTREHVTLVQFEELIEQEEVPDKCLDYFEPYVSLDSSKLSGKVEI